jgi:hypothetical protein
MEGVLSGLAHAARHNVVHRDLKPDNLLISSDGRIGIADWEQLETLITRLLGPHWRRRALLLEPDQEPDRPHRAPVSSTDQEDGYETYSERPQPPFDSSPTPPVAEFEPSPGPVPGVDDDVRPAASAAAGATATDANGDSAAPPDDHRPEPEAKRPDAGVNFTLPLRRAIPQPDTARKGRERQAQPRRFVTPGRLLRLGASSSSLAPRGWRHARSTSSASTRPVETSSPCTRVCRTTCRSGSRCIHPSVTPGHAPERARQTPCHLHRSRTALEGRRREPAAAARARAYPPLSTYS